MTKKLIGLLTAAVMAVSLFLVNVSAAGQHWLTIDFEEDMVGTVPASFPNEGSTPQGAVKIVENEDGNKVFRFNNMSATNAINVRNAGSVNATEMMIMFDFKMNSSADPASKYLCVDLHAGSGTGTRYSMLIREDNVESGGAFSDGQWSKPFANTRGEWYTYLIYWRNVKTSNSVADLYRKERDSDADFTYIGTSKPATGAGWGNATFRIYGNGIDCSLDNIVMWNGTFAGDAAFKMDDEAISEIGQVTSGTLSATATVISDGSSVQSLIPSMVIFDGAGRMVDCKFETGVNTTVGVNTLSASVDTSEYFANLEGGKAEFYVWEDILLARPAMEPAVLD